MNYRSTRNSALNVTSAHAITKGLSDEGGLYVPESIPQLSKDEILAMCDMSYADRAFEVFSRLLTDFTADEIRHCVDSAYNDKNFDSNNIAELAKLIPGTYVLELWHGPTCAFKDMALQILPYLLTTSAKKTVDGKQIAILVATSGDTGKAALEGFKDVDGTSISVFYPEDGVSKMQKRQMTTQEGKNVNVCAVRVTSTTARTALRLSSLIRPLPTDLQRTISCCPALTPSTGADWLRRSFTTFLHTQSCSRTRGSNTARRST